MRRHIISVLAVAALMAAMMVASAMPAFAAANEQAPCRGELESEAEPGPTKARGSVAKEGAFKGVGRKEGTQQESGNCNGYLTPLSPPGFINR